MDYLIKDTVDKLENILKEAYSLGLSDGTKGEFNQEVYLFYF